MIFKDFCKKKKIREGEYTELLVMLEIGADINQFFDIGHRYIMNAELLSRNDLQ